MLFRPRAAACALFSALLLTALIAEPVCAQKRRASSSTGRASGGTDRAAAIGSRVIATVNGEKITLAQVVDGLLTDQTARLEARDARFADRNRPVAAAVGALALKRMSAAGGAPVSLTRADIYAWFLKDKPQVFLEAVQNKISELAIQQAVRKRNITVTRAEIDREVATAIERVRQQMRLTGKTDAEILAAFGTRRDTLTRLTAVQIGLQKMIRQELEQRLGHPLGHNDYLEASHILVQVNPNAPVASPGGAPPSADPADREKAFAEAKKRIEEIAEEIRSGKKSFEEAAREYNNDATKFRGGSVGIFIHRSGTMVSAFEEAAFKLQKGQISEPVRTDFGWHLIRLERRGDEMTAPERDQVLQNYLRSRLQIKVQELVAQAKVTNTLPLPAPPPGMMPQE
jgi:parvulin-like peptidyl-prolyl isomerase